MIYPILSIVIVNYNYGRFLEAAIESVLSQGMDEKVELIIVDGGSTDNSVEIIKKYAGETISRVERNVEICKCANEATANSQLVGGGLSHFHTSTLLHSRISWWCSEKDKGQSDAFNKGFAHARGKYLTWVNADDIMPRDVCRRLFENWSGILTVNGLRATFTASRKMVVLSSVHGVRTVCRNGCSRGDSR